MTEILSSLSKRLCITSDAIKRKAEELYRLAEIRSGSTGAVNMSSTCQAVICLELASLQFGERVDRNEAVRLSGTVKKVYLNSLGIIQCVLGLQNSVTIADLVVQFGCTDAKSLALQLLRQYEETLQGREAGTSEQSVFCAAALYTATKKLKMKIDKRKLLEASGARKSVLDKIILEMEKIVANISDSSKKSLQPEEKSLALTIESLAKDGSSDSAVLTGAYNKEYEEDDEPYEQWKHRTLISAYKQLGRVYTGEVTA